MDGPGTWVVRLAVENAGGEKHTSEISTSVLPALALSGYAVPLVWLRVLDVMTSRSELCMAKHPGLASVETREGTGIGGSGMSWAPSGARLAHGGSASRGAFNLCLYELATSVSTPLHAPNGVISGPCWSRSGEWIAYVDDSRIIVADELTLIRPDGTGLRYLSGEAPKDEFFGFWPSWSPDDTKLAIGNARFYPGGTRVKRIAIHSGLLGTPSRDQLNSEAALASFLARNVARLGAVNPMTVIEGTNGCAWSPGGSWIAYPIALNPANMDAIGHALVIADAAGSGQMHLLDWSIAWDAISSVSWSPDETHIYYQKGQGLFRIHPGGGPPEDLSSSRGQKFLGGSAPTLYR